MRSMQNYICVYKFVHEQHSAMTLINQHGQVNLPFLQIILGHI